MDFKIDNESFAAAYRCLRDANVLVDAGLGSFNELQDHALLLINKKNLKNDDFLNTISTECDLLKNRMYSTIEILSKMNADSADYFEDILSEEFDDLDFGNNNKDVEITSYDAVSADGIKYEVDVIGEPNEKTTIILLNHGGGGSYKALDSYLENESIDKENVIIIRYPRDGKSDKSYKLMEEVSEKYNIPIQNCTTAGFSAGGKYAIKQMAALVSEHPEIKQPVVMLLDAYKASSKVTDKELEVLGNSGAILFSIQRNGVDQEYIKHDKWSEQFGINFVKVKDNQCKTKSDPHNAVFSGYFENGVIDYQAGNGDFRVETLTNRNGKTMNSYESPIFYNSETGTWDNFEVDNNSPTISLSTDEFENSEVILSEAKDISDGGKVELAEIDQEIPKFKDKSDTDNIEPSSTDTLTSEVKDKSEADKVETIHTEVPLFYQSDYSNVNYGSGTLATHGCGIASLSMVASYYNDTNIMPDELAKKYRGYGSSSGTDHGIYEKTADDLGLPFRERLHYCNGKDLQTVVEALNEGCVVVAKAKKSSVFTDSGHYIVLTGVSDDGKIYVNDPNKYNYNNKYLKDGYENGFEQEQFKYGRVSDFFIYDPKSDS